MVTILVILIILLIIIVMKDNSSSKTVCPYCFTEISVEEGDHKCNCGNTFRKIGNTIYKHSEVPFAINEYSFVLLNIVAKDEDGNVSHELKEILKHKARIPLCMHDNQINWIYTSEHSSININDYNVMIKKLNSTKKLYTKSYFKEFCEALLTSLIEINLINNNIHNDIVNYYIKFFEISFEDFLKAKGFAEKFVKDYFER